MVQTNIFFGIRDLAINRVTSFIGTNAWLSYVNIGVFAVCFLFFEVQFRKMRVQEDQFEVHEGHIQMTPQEFEKRIKRGERLHILDNLVLDLKDFARKHPGGANLITHSIGRDISKFFYGAYAMDGNSNDP